MPKIKELGARGGGRRPYIVDGDDGVWGVPEGKVRGWIRSHPDDTAEDLEEFFREEIESPAECGVRFHCFSIEPLRLAVSVDDEGTANLPGWWAV